MDVAKAQLEQVRLEVRVRVHKAFDDLLLADDELRIHDQHRGDCAPGHRGGAHQVRGREGPQQDILKAQVDADAAWRNT